MSALYLVDQELKVQQRQRFGLHPCGEGGEYETFTVDCPLFKKRIDLYVAPLALLMSS